MNQENKTYTFHVSGMHCKACVMLTEEEIKEHPNVTAATTSLKTQSVEVTGHFGDATPEAIAQELTRMLTKHGYTLSVEKPKKVVKWKEFNTAIPFVLAFVLVFIFLQKIGIINMVDTSKVTYGTAFIVGVIASLSTCMAMVGGLVLSMSATFAREGDTVKPQVLFHAGRIISFFVLGGIIGSAGAVFQLGHLGIFVTSMVVGVVMLILGINLLDIFHSTKRFQFTMPKVFSQKVLDVTKVNHTFTPALVGMATFFLPCGFTQSMQLYSLTTGSFLQGGLTMLSFALGTFPVLALISFSSLSIHKQSSSGVFFKTAGLIVILFALFNILNSFVAMGWLAPIFNF
jgi:sulfite exporter TauE/SafE/copper chaperone CopZ